MPVYRLGSKNVLFIHVPKTAGMAIDGHLKALSTPIFDEKILVKGGKFLPRHQPAEVLEKVFLPEMVDYAFMVVRHPVARLVSEYRYQCRRGGIQLTRFRAFGFDAWLRYALYRMKSDPHWRDSHFLPQVNYECFGCDVFKYEDGLEAVIKQLISVAQVDLPLATAVRNPSAQRTVSISRRSLALIAETYSKDFERFGYQVEVPKIKDVIVT